MPLLAIGCRRWPCRLFRWASNLAFQRRCTKRKRHWKIAQPCRSPTVSARLRYHVSNSVVFVHHAGTLAKGYPPSKLFSKAEPLPFEKEININLVYFSCLKHVNEMLMGDPRQAHQRTQSFHFPSSFINHSILLLERSSAKLLVFTCTRTLDRLCIGSADWTSRRRVRSTRRWGNHMHDHSRFPQDFDDVTGVSLSLSTTTTTTTHKSHSRTI